MVTATRCLSGVPGARSGVGPAGRGGADREDRGDPPERDRPEREAGRPARAAHEGPRLRPGEVRGRRPTCRRPCGTASSPSRGPSTPTSASPTARGGTTARPTPTAWRSSSSASPGEKLLEDEKDATTQDFVLFDNPVFFIKDVADYVPFMEDFRNLKSSGLIVRQGRRRAQAPLLAGLQVAAAAGHRQQEARQPAAIHVLEHDPLEARRRGREVPRHARPRRRAAASASVDSPDKLRLAMVGPPEGPRGPLRLLRPGADRSRRDARRGPDRRVGRALPEGRHDPHPAPGVRHARAETFGENLSFTPWHSLPEHRPLGGINRARKAIYRAISRQRHELEWRPHDASRRSDRGNLKPDTSWR